MKHLRLLPLALLLALLATLGLALLRDKSEDPLHSARVGQRFASMILPELNAVDGSTEHSLVLDDILLGNGKLTLVNVFASWCQPCKVEHPVLKDLRDVPVLGIAWKDTSEKTTRYLQEHGNPYSAGIAIDTQGNSTIALGLTGVPESFLVDGEGTIRFHYRSALTPELMQDTLLPLIRSLKEGTHAQ
jgi:cytochrome c biogenesis protein CcmG, thiol:disulfide interchange protein DsbE